MGKVSDFPDIEIVPDIGLIKPAIVFNKVVFPIPDSPVNAITSPGNTSNSSIENRGSLVLYPRTKSLRVINGRISLISSIIITPPHNYYAYVDYISYFPSK